MKEGLKENLMVEFGAWLLTNSIKKIEECLGIDIDAEYDKDGLDRVHKSLGEMTQPVIDIVFKDWNDKGLLIEAVENYVEFRRSHDAGITESECSGCGAC